MPPTDPKELLRLIGEAPRESLPVILTTVMARMLEMSTAEKVLALPVPDPPRTPEGDRWLDAGQVGLILGLDPQTVTRRLAHVAWRRKIGRRTVRYSEAGLRRWMRTGAP